MGDLWVLFRFLGPIEVEGVSWRSLAAPSLRALLLALLLERGRPTGRELLIRLLWDDPPRSAEANIRQHVMRLRAVLASQPKLQCQITTIRGGGGGGGGAYQLQIPSDETDLALFEELMAKGRSQADVGDREAAVETMKAALALWRGPAGVNIIGSRQLRDRLTALNEQRYILHEEWLENRMILVPPGRLVPEIRSFVADHPMRERSHVLLIRALYEAGNTAGALIAYEDARTLLFEELGHTPGPEMQRVYAAVLDHNPAVASAIRN
ncbi:AfsR/SARP family transcriptional regulator [Microtetraspora malaysiensis]|uniref:AfsR/SARP family transcriptional regulator n=1 Tax=Microtetraspora malaysiensis TaxID=161358 RepID=UPI000A03DB23